MSSKEMEIRRLEAEAARLLCVCSNCHYAIAGATAQGAKDTFTDSYIVTYKQYLTVLSQIEELKKVN